MRSVPERIDTVIVGGGVLGCAAAWELARRGHRTVLLERGDIGCAISGGSLAAVTRHLVSEPDELGFVMDSCDRWDAMADELLRLTGIDIELDRVGQLRVVERGDGMDDALAEVARGVEAEHALGLDVRMVDADEIARIAPALNLAVVAGGSFCPVDGKLNPLATVRALAAAARRAGAEIRTGTDVLGIEPGEPAVVRTSRGPVEAGQVVVAAGPWSQTLLAPLDERLALGLVPKRAQCCATAAVPPVIAPVLASVSVGISEGYTQLHQTRAGQVLFNTVVRSDDPRRDGDLVNLVDAHFLVESARTLARLLPALRDAPLQRSWDACESWTGDHRLAIGQVPGAPGVLVCSGDSGTGFLRAPAAARAVAALVEGSAPDFDLAPYAPTREGLDDGARLAEALYA
jgi:glycine/D-amino acid oxidase-like deaminating enzyme